MKKYFIIVLCIFISLCASMTNSQNLFLTDSKLLIEILLTLLGLSFTSFSFISTSIDNILKKTEHNNRELLKEKLNKMLKSIQDDIFFIFKLSLVLIVINLIKHLDIPFFINPQNIDFGIIIIDSAKDTVINFSISLVFCLSMYSFYDLIKATFMLLRNQY